MRIAIFIDEMALGGTERRAISLVNYLRRTSKHALLYSIKDGLTVEHFKERKGKNTGLIIRAIQLIKLSNFLFEFRPQVIHTMDWSSTFHVSLLKFITPESIMISGYGAGVIDDPRIVRFLQSRWNKTSSYICNSQKGKNAILEVLPDADVKVIHNGLPEVVQSNNKPPFPILKNHVRIGYIGKLDRYKHGERMVEIAINLHERSYRNIQFIIIGEGENMSAAKELLDEYPELKEKVILTGNIPNAAAFAGHFDIGVLCSDTEGTPNVIIEFMSLGIPVVSTDVGDIRNLVGDDAGILAPKYEPEVFTSAIEQLIQSKEKRETMGMAARKRYKEHFTLEKMGKKYEDFYQDIIKNQEPKCAE